MKYLIAFVLAWASNYAKGQSFVGQVLDAETNEPIPFATILMTETHNGVVSDVEGHFYIQNYPRTDLKVQISSIGYETFVENIDLSETKEKTFLLHPSHFELEEVIVSFPVSKLNDENIVEVETKRFEPLTGGTVSLAQSLASIPGVDQVSTGSGIGKPVIRGLSGNRIVVYTQGVRLENQQFGDEHGLGENSVGINRVEVIKGPASLLYGADALGGVLYLVPDRYASMDDTEGFISSQYLTNAHTITSSGGFKINRGGIKFNAFGSYASNTDYAVPGAGGQRAFNTRFDETSLKGSMGYNRKNWVGNLRYGYLRNHFGIPEGELGTSTSRTKILPFQDVSQHIVSLENVFFTKKSEISATIGYGVNGRQEFEESPEEAALDMTLRTWTFNFKSITKLSEQLQLIGGIQGMNRKNINAGEELLIPNATTRDAGLFTVVNADMEKIQLQAGARIDFRNIATEAYSDPEKTIPKLDRDFSSANFSFGSSMKQGKMTYRLNIATGFRPPNTAELLSNGTHEGTLRYEIGDATLKNERALQTDLNVQFENKHLTLAINPFYNRINDYIFLAPTGGIMDGSNVFTYEQTHAQLYGGEIGMHFHPHSIHWLHIESDFSSVFAEDDQQNPLPLIPANRLKTRINVEYHPKDGITGNVYVSHLYKAPQDRVAAMELASSSYQLIDIGTSVEVGSIKCELGVNNLFDANYIDHLSRLKNDGIPNPGRNIFVGIKYDF